MSDDDIKSKIFYTPPSGGTYKISGYYLTLNGGQTYTIGDLLDGAYKKGAESVLSKYPSPNALIILVEDLIQKHNTMYAADALGKLFECDFRDSAIVAKQWLKGFKGEK